MTKQKEIREGMEDIIQEYSGFEIPEWYLTERLIGYLHSEGVVIKAEKELPHKMPAVPCNEWSAGYSCGEEFMQEIMVEQGYVAVESLVKEE